MLVDAKADPNLRSGDATGTSPDVWAELLQCGNAWAGFTCNHITSSLTWATLKKSAPKVKILIDAKADVNFMNVNQDRSSTVLFLAVEMGSTDIVKLLVEAKAVLDVLNHEAYTVLDVAERKGHDDIVQLLLDAGAPRGVWWRMQQACIHGRAEEVKLLLDAGYLLHLQDSYSQMPLVLAVQHGHADIAQMLIAAGAEVNPPGTSLLFTSIKQHNIVIVHSLVAAHADVNVRDDLHCPIIYSIQRGDLELTKSLIDARAHVDLTPLSSAKTALCMAAERGDIGAARLLIDAKANLHHIFNQMTPLAYAAENGRLEMVKLLLDAKAPANGSNGLALLCATRKGHAEAVQMLLDAKASLESRGLSGSSPLSSAIYGGHAHVVTMLLAAKAPLVTSAGSTNILAVAEDKPEIMKILIDAKAPLETATGTISPLLNAIWDKNLPAMRVLLEAKAATDIPGTDYGSQLLLRALNIGKPYQNDNVLRLLLDADPSLALNQQSSRFMGLLYKEKRFSTLGLLLEKHASVDGVTVDGAPILYQAAFDNRAPVVKMMIDAKADLNVRGPRFHGTPLILASRRRYRDIVQMLLEAKATLDAEDRDGYTPLRHAVDVLHGTLKQYPVDESIVQMLVDAKAPLEYSALKAAVDAQESAVVKILVDAKADLRVKDSYGQTFLTRAVNNRSKRTIDMLLTVDSSLFDECDYIGRTALMCAIYARPAHEDASIVRMLLERAWKHCAAESGNEPPAKRFKKTD